MPPGYSFRLSWYLFQRPFEIAHPETFWIPACMKCKRRMFYGVVSAVLPPDSIQNQSAVAGIPAYWAYFIHGPGEGHDTIPANPPISRPEPGYATSGRRRDDGAQGFRPNRKKRISPQQPPPPSQPTIRWHPEAYPRDFGFALQTTHRPGPGTGSRLRQQNGACRVQPLDHRCGMIEHLVLVWRRPPGSRITRQGHQIFYPIRNPMQRTAVPAFGDFGVARRAWLSARSSSKVITAFKEGSYVCIRSRNSRVNDSEVICRLRIRTASAETG